MLPTSILGRNLTSVAASGNGTSFNTRGDNRKTGAMLWGSVRALEVRARPGVIRPVTAVTVSVTRAADHSRVHSPACTRPCSFVAMAC